MNLSPEVLAFVQSAVRLPEARLRQIDRGWDQLQPHRAVVAELLQNSEQLCQDLAGALRTREHPPVISLKRSITPLLGTK